MPAEPPIHAEADGHSGEVWPDNQHQTWRRIRATVENFGGTEAARNVWTGGVRVEIDIEVDDRGAPSCRGLRITPYEGGRPITGTLLRDVAIDRLMRRAVTRETIKWEPQGEGLARAVRFDARAFLEEYRHGARQPRRGSPVTAADLSRVADMYQAAYEAGHAPTKAISEEFKVDRSTARRWVQRARKEGLLGPARPGRASA